MQRKQHELPDGKKMVTDHVDVTMNVDLRDKIAAAADRADVPMTELIRKILAGHFKNPDLARMPRPRAGRPRKESVPEGENGNGHSRRRQAS